EQADQIPRVRILRAIRWSELAQHKADVALTPFQRDVCAYIPEQSLPDMTVSINEPRHDNPVRGVNYFCTVGTEVGAEVWADGGNFRALDQHVGVSEIAELRIHRQHRAAFDEDLAVSGRERRCIADIDPG